MRTEAPLTVIASAILLFMEIKFLGVRESEAAKRINILRTLLKNITTDHKR